MNRKYKTGEARPFFETTQLLSSSDVLYRPLKPEPSTSVYTKFSGVMAEKFDQLKQHTLAYLQKIDIYESIHYTQFFYRWHYYSAVKAQKNQLIPSSFLALHCFKSFSFFIGDTRYRSGITFSKSNLPFWLTKKERRLVTFIKKSLYYDDSRIIPKRIRNYWMTYGRYIGDIQYSIEDYGIFLSIKMYLYWYWMHKFRHFYLTRMIIYINIAFVLYLIILYYVF